MIRLKLKFQPAVVLSEQKAKIQGVAVNLPNCLLELDPANVQDYQITGTLKKGDIPYLNSQQLKFGYMPNINNLCHGDLILTSGNNFISKTIIEAQALQFPETCQWTHAAVYVSDWEIIEALPFKGISMGSIRTFVPKQKLMFRRPNKIVEAGSLMHAENLGLKVALCAALHIEKSTYGLATAMDVGARIYDKLTRSFRRNDEQYMKSIICSGLYAKCAFIGAGQIVCSPATDSAYYPCDAGWCFIT